MTKALEGNLRVAIDVASEDTYGIDGQKATQSPNLATTMDLDATCDVLFHEEGTLADDASTEIDFLAEVDPYGDAINLDEVHGIYIKNTTAAGGANLIIGASAANAWSAIFGDPSDTIILGPGLAILLPMVAGSTEADVDATHKMLKILHDGTGSADATYEVAVVGKAT